MSHDRGCPCGREFYEYKECKETNCFKQNKKRYDTLVFVGRFQPFHNGHKAVIDKALEHAKEVVIVLGSCFQPRSAKNPFTFEERKAMIRSIYNTTMGINPDRLKIVGVMDYPYDDNAWVSAVQTVVNNVKKGTKTGLIGHSKDHTSFYLKIFPDWKDHIEVGNVNGINATDIRDAMFGANDKDLNIDNIIPKEVSKTLAKFFADGPDGYAEWVLDLRHEYSQIQKYREKAQMKGFNFPSVFVTTDAVLTQSGSILLIKRGGFPYKNCWALPGGYLDKRQMILGNMIKELREETCVKVPEKVLKGSIKGAQVFDHPDRDPRGRVITHGFYVDLGFPEEGLPKVKGGDDAKEAKWFKLSEVTSDMMAFDHYHIIKHFIPTY